MAGLLVVPETGGEVVVIHIANEQGEEQSTRIWVMDLDGKLYVEGLAPEIKREALREIRQSAWFAPR